MHIGRILMTTSDLTAWIKQHKNECLTFVKRSFISSPEAAEDIVQDQCLIAYRHISFTEFTDFRAWFFQGLHLVANNYYRTHKRYSISDYEFESTGGLNPEEIYMNKQTLKKLRSYINGLTDKRKAAINSYYMEEEYLNVKDQGYETLKTHRRLGLEELKKKMAETGDLCYPNYITTMKIREQ
jgi:RNA polymerase sigma factor (sigma-70 family)